jgi:hypothetical protein
MTPSPEDPRSPDEPEPDTEGADRIRRILGPDHIAADSNLRWPIEKRGARAQPNVCVEICTFRLASEPVPHPLECYEFEGYSGALVRDVRFSDKSVAMQLPVTAERKRVRFRLFRVPLERVPDTEHEPRFPCFIAKKPSNAQLVAVDAYEKCAYFLMEGDAEVVLSPPGFTRFIAARPMEPAPGHFRFLGAIEADGELWCLYCLSLHYVDRPKINPWADTGGQDLSGGPTPPEREDPGDSGPTPPERPDPSDSGPTPSDSE